MGGTIEGGGRTAGWRWCDWLVALKPEDQTTHDAASRTSYQAFCGGIESEAVRLRPLLDQCKAVVLAQAELNRRLRRPDAEAGALLGALLADLRRELEEDGGHTRPLDPPTP